MPAWVGGCSIMHLCCGRRWRSGTVPPLRCGVCLYGALPGPVQGSGTVQLGPYSPGAFLPPISPAGAATASDPVAPPFSCRTQPHLPHRGPNHPRQALSCLWHIHWGWPAGHLLGPPRSFLERMKALFMRWPIMADLSSTLMSFVFSRVLILLMAAHLPVFSSSDVSVQRGPHSSPYGAGPSTSGPGYAVKDKARGPQGCPVFDASV